MRLFYLTIMVNQSSFKKSTCRMLYAKTVLLLSFLLLILRIIMPGSANFEILTYNPFGEFLTRLGGP